MLNETVKHYDLEVDFFQKFLDLYMKYTSGLFESETDELHVATQRMLDVIIDSGKIRPGGRVLEIGPGWGALIKRIRERAILCDYTGVSPSVVQNRYIDKFCGERERLVTSTFEDFDCRSQRFDAIVLIGSFLPPSRQTISITEDERTACGGRFDRHRRYIFCNQ